MKIEILFPEQGYLYGDMGNVKYLKACLPDAEFIETTLEDVPAFAEGDVDLVYMGYLSEDMQRKVIEKLRPYKERIQEMIQSKVCILFTGNAMEVLFKEIVKGDDVTEGLDIFDFTAIIDPKRRYVGNYYGQFNERKIVGCKIQEAVTYGANQDCCFGKGIRGMGINRSTIYEGIRKNNFIGTYLIGPLLIMNPYFTHFLFARMGIAKPRLAFSGALKEAYGQRVEEFENKSTVMEIV
ncbi:hypothetical protein [Frisingicoccus sp.]|uniref:hypothetical protein n=1 Tax=Frisingicoccus sp. TaxID=1918627 RepID=UPI002E98F8DC|nr:hypothetical protein [Frisingicoccus sp.]